MFDVDAHLNRMERKHNSFVEDSFTENEIEEVFNKAEQMIDDCEKYMLDSLSPRQQEIFNHTIYLSVNEYNLGGRK